MENKHKIIIQKNYEALVKDCMSFDHIIRILVAKNIWSSSCMENCNREKNHLERLRFLFRQIRNCGKNAFKELVLALRETNQEKLANLLDPNRKYESPRMNPNHRIFSHGVLDINVIRSKEFCDIGSEIPTYKCHSMNRGAVLVANNYSFDPSELEARQGSQYDVDNLNNLFSQLNFKIERVENQNVQDLEKAIKEFYLNGDKYDCLFLILMSHGGQDSQGTYIYGSDGQQLYTQTIEHYATNAVSHHLYGIPKVILYNICRGNKVDLGTRVLMSKTATESAATLKVQSFSDLLIGNATLLDYVAHRDYEKGAWYIRCLVEVIAKYAHANHMEDMLKLVYERVANYRSDRFSMQTTTYTNIGFKRLYLNPGIYKEKDELKHFDAEDNVNSQSNGNVPSSIPASNEDVDDSHVAISGDTVEN